MILPPQPAFLSVVGGFFYFVQNRRVSMPLPLKYFYGAEAEQYSFYKIPKTLFTDHHYQGVSLEASSTASCWTA